MDESNRIRQVAWEMMEEDWRRKQEADRLTWSKAEQAEYDA
jgi:hypothetical protein